MPPKKGKSQKTGTKAHVSVNGHIFGNIVIGNENTINQSASELPGTQGEKDILFDAGHRLRQVREEIDIKSSEFVEELGLPGQRDYLEMENDGEVPLSLLKKVHDLTGVSLDWLIHGYGQRYEIEESGFNPVSEGLDFIAKLKPQKVFFVLGRSAIAINNLLTGIVVQTGKYKYQVIDYGMHFDFWNWYDELAYIPLFYEFLSVLWDRHYGPHGIAIPIRYYKQLFEGKIHFHEARGHTNRKYLFWPNAILDINYENQNKSHYERYYGKWVSKVHNKYKEISIAVGERKPP